jgi:uncharacterized secreted protein with C-terminal beta-propeller domain
MELEFCRKIGYHFKLKIPENMSDLSFFQLLMIYFFVALLMSVSSVASAQTDTQITTMFDNDKHIINRDYKQFTSCDQLVSTINEFYQKIPAQPAIIPYMMLREQTTSDMTIESVVAGLPRESVVAGTSAPQTTNNLDFSTTNNQVAGVQEPDIVKNNGDYIFHANNTTKKIHIIKTPLNQANQTIDIARVSVINTIKLPDQVIFTDLLLHNNRLVIVGRTQSRFWSAQKP